MGTCRGCWSRRQLCTSLLVARQECMQDYALLACCSCKGDYDPKSEVQNLWDKQKIMCRAAALLLRDTYMSRSVSQNMDDNSILKQISVPLGFSCSLPLFPATVVLRGAGEYPGAWAHGPGTNCKAPNKCNVLDWLECHRWGSLVNSPIPGYLPA